MVKFLSHFFLPTFALFSSPLPSHDLIKLHITAFCVFRCGIGTHTAEPERQMREVSDERYAIAQLDMMIDSSRMTREKSISNIRLDATLVCTSPLAERSRRATRRDNINLCLIFTFSSPRLSLRPTKYSTKKKISEHFSVLITLLNKINFSFEIHIHPDGT
jgi:hypothetical protein